MFVGRKKELDALNSRYKSNRKEFGVLYGRRRIGKSSILNEFLKGKKGILFQAKQDNSYGNLKSFSYEVDHLLNLPDTFVFASWQHADSGNLKITNLDRLIFTKNGEFTI